MCRWLRWDDDQLCETFQYFNLYDCGCLAYVDKLALIPEWSYSSENSADCRSSDLSLGSFPTSLLSPCFRIGTQAGNWVRLLSNSSIPYQTNLAGEGGLFTASVPVVNRQMLKQERKGGKKIKTVIRRHGRINTIIKHKVMRQYIRLQTAHKHTDMAAYISNEFSDVKQPVINKIYCSWRRN